MKTRPTLLNCAVWSAVVTTMCASACGGDFVMSLQVAQGDKKVSTKLTRQKPSATKRKPRLVFQAEAGKRVRVKWKAMSESKSATYRNVLVHFFLVREKTVGQPGVPRLDDVEHEGAVTLDFKPGSKVEGEFTATIPKAGSYLVRVETIGLSRREGHEFYAALDVVLK